MTATTIDQRTPFNLVFPALRLLLAFAIAIAVLAATFVVGRASAPTHTVRTVVTVPAAASAPTDSCRRGRPC
jgi:hypothetical protein